MSNLEDVKAKIAAMLEVTEGRGATEAEAVNAIRMANKLMSKYGLTLDDIRERRVNPSDFVSRSSGESRKKLHEVDLHLAPAISRYCDCVAYADRSVKHNSDIVYFGYSVDVELAYYIRSVVRSAMENDWQRFYASIKKSNVHGRIVRTNFMQGFIDRMIERLDTMKAEQQEVVECYALVVAKTALVKAAFDKKISGNNNSKYTYIPNPYAAGFECANNVVFNRTVGENSIRLIGSK